MSSAKEMLTNLPALVSIRVKKLSKTEANRFGFFRTLAQTLTGSVFIYDTIISHAQRYFDISKVLKENGPNNAPCKKANWKTVS